MIADLISLRFGRDRGLMPPPGVLALAGSLEAAGINWRIHDTQTMKGFDPFAVGKLSKLLLDCNSEVIGISLFNDAIPLLVAAMERIEGQLGGRRVFIGGPGTVGIASELVERLTDVEAVVVGEGETVFPRIILEGCERNSIPGVFGRSAEGVTQGTGMTSRENLNQIPPPAWEWCRGRGFNVVPLSTMRGCPFDCKFCEITAFMGRRITRMELDRVMGELNRAVECVGSRTVSVLDDTFTISKPRVLQFCERVRDLSYEIEFSIFSRIDTIDQEMMEALRSAGCRRVFFGIDGGDDEVLKLVAKNISVAKAANVLEIASQYFDVVPSFIWGYPFESEAAFERMLDWMETLASFSGSHSMFPQLHLLSPSAGTELFTQYSSEMLFTENTEVLPIGTAMEVISNRDGYGEVLDVIQSSKRLGAPYYRYHTPAFVKKVRRVENFRRLIDRAIGDSAKKSVEDCHA